MGAVGIWIGFVVGLSVAAVCLHTRFRIQYKKLSTRQIAKKISNF
jgi:Na+-driven multidrug efflux pump